MAPLRVPKAYQPGLIQLGVISDQSFQELLTAIGDMPRTLNLRNVSTRISVDVQSIPTADTKAIVETLLAMYVARNRMGIGVSEFVDGIAQSLAAASDFSEVTPGTRQLIADRLRSLLGFEDTIGLSSKAIGVLFHSQVSLRQVAGMNHA